jgi:hypothetical protein
MICSLKKKMKRVTTAKTFLLMPANTVAFMIRVVLSCAIPAKSGFAMGKEAHLGLILSTT